MIRCPAIEDTGAALADFVAMSAALVRASMSDDENTANAVWIYFT